MKQIQKFISRKIMDENLLIPIGETAQTFNGMVVLSDVGNFIWNNVERASSLNELIKLIVDAYDVDANEASQDAISFLTQLLNAGMLRPETQEW